MSERATPRFVSYEGLRDGELEKYGRPLLEEMDDEMVAYWTDYPAGIALCEGESCREPRVPLLEVGDMVLCETCLEALLEPDDEDLVVLLNRRNDS